MRQPSRGSVEVGAILRWLQDFKAHLDEQLDFLRSSAAAFDAGKEHESKRLALHIRTLVHNTRRSTSLLEHLGVRSQLGYIDRGPPAPPSERVILIHFGLCVVAAWLGPDGESRYQPAIWRPAHDRFHPPVSLEDWWRRTVLTDQPGNTFSRADLALALADQDGGAHIDAALDEKYRALARENSVGFMRSAEQRLANSIVHASVRQIAEELMQTIEEGLVWQDGKAVAARPVCPLPLAQGSSAGRNDPCPCGSGKKWKRCFGLRKPLNVMEQPPSDSQTGQVHPLPQIPSERGGPPREPDLELDCLMLVPVTD